MGRELRGAGIAGVAYFWTMVPHRFVEHPIKTTFSYGSQKQTVVRPRTETQTRLDVISRSEKNMSGWV